LNLCDHLRLLLTPGYVKAATATEKQIGIGIERERERGYNNKISTQNTAPQTEPNQPTRKKKKTEK
jgi:hypothetical protein